MTRPVWWRMLRAAARDTRNAIALVILGPTCRVDHEHYEHPTDGPCVLL